MLVTGLLAVASTATYIEIPSHHPRHPLLDTFDNEGVPDRNLENVRNGKKAREILQIQVMPGIDPHSSFLHGSCGIGEVLKDHIAAG